MKNTFAQRVVSTACLLLLTAALLAMSTTVSTQLVSACSAEINYEEIGDDYGICPELLEALVESEGADDTTGAIHLYLDDCSQQLDELELTEEDVINDDYSNVIVGAAKLTELFEEYEDPDVVIGLFTHVDSNSNYVTSILERSANLERMHGK
jgi:hypothetical protein